MIRAHDTASRRQVDMLAALLDHDTPPWRPGEFPPLAHWLLFPPVERQSRIGQDGHPLRADAGDLPRRMWAGGRVRFLASIPIDATLDRESEEIKVEEKIGRSGRMRFVTLRHRIYREGTLAIEEEQDLVYREAAVPGSTMPLVAAAAATSLPQDTRHVRADTVQLFRFSALTFNAHRIHYDRDYAVRQEGYPALVVHGPYIATLLMDHYLRAHPAPAIAHFAFRAVRPIFDTDPFSLASVEQQGSTSLMAIDATGAPAMTAEVKQV